METELQLQADHLVYLSLVCATRTDSATRARRHVRGATGTDPVTCAARRLAQAT